MATGYGVSVCISVDNFILTNEWEEQSSSFGEGVPGDL